MEKEKITFTKEMLIKKVAEVSNKSGNTVRSVYNTFEKTIADLLASADKDTDITLRLFEGITLNSTFIPEKSKLNNLTGEVITTTSKIKPKANITRNYGEKLTNYNK